MKISYKWLGEWVDLSGFKSPQEVADLLTARGLEVEHIARQDQGLEKVISAQIVSRDKHPEADRLSLCKVNPGNGAEMLDIVCGAQNMKAGDIVALAQIGALLPNGMKIEKGKIRGQVSMGMLCSEAELGFKDKSEGILILPPKTPLGWKLADVLGIDDTIIEIKLTANRGDCLSHRGIAREVAAALGKPLKSPRVHAFQGTGSPIKISLNAGEDAPQFFGAYLRGVKIGPSPEWLKKRLESIGQRSINNLVDVSNYLMFEYGFPVHIYDADKLEGGVIEVRRAKKGEKIPLLDGGEVETIGEELLIVDGKKPVGLAGVMGGGNSEVSDSTKNVFLECAEFNPTLVRRAAFRFNRRSEASLRFEKGIDPRGHRETIGRLVDLVIKVAQGELVGEGFAETASRAKYSSEQITTDVNFINTFLGTSLDDDAIVRILERLECKVKKGVNGLLMVTPPTYRLDLNIREDLAEEVARSIGYDQIPITVPALTGQPKGRLGDSRVHRLSVIESVKDHLAALGLHEVISYSFQSESWIRKFGFEPTVKILNPLSEEQGFMIPSLLPGIIRAYQENERHHFGMDPLAVRLFELRPVFEVKNKNEAVAAKGESETGVAERFKLSVLISGPSLAQAIQSERGEVDFYDLKAIIESLFDAIGTKGVRVRAATSETLGIHARCFHPGQTIQIACGKESVGFAGRIHPKLEAELKIRSPIFWAELEIEPVIALTPEKEPSFKAWPAFPNMERDFALLLDDGVPAENLIQSALKYGKPIAKVVKIFDTYKGAHIPEGKISIGVRVIFLDETKSLEEKQVDECSAQIVRKWNEEFGATLR